MATRRPQARRGILARTAKSAQQKEPWSKGDPTKKICLNVPFPETTMLQLEYLIEHGAIHSKSSFIREAVDIAAANAVKKQRRIEEAVRRIEEEDRSRR